MRLYGKLVLVLAATVGLLGCGVSGSRTTPTATVYIPPTATVAPPASPTPLPTAPPTPAERPLTVQESAATALSDLDLQSEDVIAKVNGEAITLGEFAQYFSLRLVALGEVNVDWSQPANAERLTNLRTQVRDQLVNMVIIRQEAAKLGIELDQAQMDTFAAQIRAQLAGSSDDEAWQAFKVQTGLDEATFAQIIRESQLLQALAEEVVVLEEVDQVEAAHILVADEVLAKELLQRARDGEDFGELAEAYSEDPGSAVDGGKLGWFPEGVMVPEFEAAAFALQPGEVSDIVQTDYGYHIIKLVGREVRALEPPYDEMARSQTFNAWFARMRTAADIQVLVAMEAPAQ